jgi:hypothetical protein
MTGKPMDAPRADAGEAMAQIMDADAFEPRGLCHSVAGAEREMARLVRLAEPAFSGKSSDQLSPLPVG